MSCIKATDVTLRKGTYNKLDVTYEGDASTLTMTFRLKETLEDTTAPLLETNVTWESTSATESVGYVEVDLSALSSLEGEYYFDFKIFVTANPSTPTYTDISKLTITTTLKV